MTEDSRHVLTDEEEFCLQGCGSYEQYFHMRHLFENEVCAFCDVNPEVNTVLYENDTWRVWDNALKNERHCSTMLVIAATEHIRKMSDITTFGWANFGNMMEWIHHEFDLDGGMLFLRFGDMRLNAGTMPHLHWNLWVPDGKGEVRIPVFKNPTQRDANVARAAEFAARYEAHEVP